MGGNRTAVKRARVQPSCPSRPSCPSSPLLPFPPLPPCISFRYGENVNIAFYFCLVLRHNYDFSVPSRQGSPGVMATQDSMPFAGVSEGSEPGFSQKRQDGPAAQGLYDPAHEHDACGVGFVVDIKGRRSHAIVEQGLRVLMVEAPARDVLVPGRACHQDAAGASGS